MITGQCPGNNSPDRVNKKNGDIPLQNYHILKEASCLSAIHYLSYLRCAQPGWWFGPIFLFFGNNVHYWRSYFSEGLEPPTTAHCLFTIWWFLQATIGHWFQMFQPFKLPRLLDRLFCHRHLKAQPLRACGPRLAKLVHNFSYPLENIQKALKKYHVYQFLIGKSSINGQFQ